MFETKVKTTEERVAEMELVVKNAFQGIMELIAPANRDQAIQLWVDGIYYIRREGAHDWRVGRYTFSQEIDFRDKSFRTSAQARAYCEKIDREAVIIEGVTA
ncbi:MAG: hypothetical protein EBV30_09945 [Actinobacteria bacterium]|nr:hypothetical protein [Actinomycetota bacterium]